MFHRVQDLLELEPEALPAGGELRDLDDARALLNARERRRRSERAAPYVRDLLVWYTRERWNTCIDDPSIADEIVERARGYARVVRATQICCVSDANEIIGSIADFGPEAANEGWVLPDALRAADAFVD